MIVKVIQHSKNDFLRVGSNRERTISCVAAGAKVTPEERVLAFKTGPVILIIDSISVITNNWVYILIESSSPTVDSKKLQTQFKVTDVPLDFSKLMGITKLGNAKIQVKMGNTGIG